jgi:molybdopterin synthase catalytic subunit
MADVGVHRKGEVNLPVLLERLRRGLSETAGAIGCFTGVVRGQSLEGGKVKHLSYEAAEEATQRLREIAEKVEKMPNVERVMIHHVVDELKAGDDAIYVLVAGIGRKEVFKALSDIMDLVKAEVPIWKKEATEKGERWAHEIR